MLLLLLLLLCVAALSHVTALHQELNITECPMTVYGTEYNSIYVSTYAGETYLCFESFKDANPNTCILLQEEFDSVQSSFLVFNVTPSVASVYPSQFGVEGFSPCQVNINLKNTTTSKSNEFYLRTYGGIYGNLRSGANDSSNYILEIGPDGNVVDSVPIQTSNQLSLTGCLEEGVLLRGNSIGCFPDGSVAICSHPNVLSKEPCKLCQNGICLGGPVCTVTASSIIDFSEESRVSITDRCGYSLLSQQGLELGAVFKDRRRKDVSLLDHLILNVGPTTIQIGQGTVKLNGSSVNISTAQMPEGITVSKTSTEVTLNYNQAFDLSFDGFSAVIVLKELSPTSLTGLCVNATSDLSIAKSTALSDYGCDVPHQDVQDNSTDCKIATQHCNLLNGSLFAPCHPFVDPAPYIAACVDTLCSYPSVDGIDCSFHQAYATLCSMGNIALPDWRTTAQCAADRGLCQDTYCSDHEFCGVELDREACLCRAVFASGYRANKTLGDPTVCSAGSASLSLVGCLLTEKGVEYSDLHLNDPSCRGLMDPESHMLTFEFDGANMCGTEVTSENNQVIFKNKVKINNETGMVTRQDQFQVDFSCFYTQPDVKTVAFKIKDSSVVQTIVSGTWSYNLIMTAYLDISRTSAIAPQTELKLGQTVWVELRTAGLDANLVSVVTDSCWATIQLQANSTPKYQLVQNGCPNTRDKSVKVIGNGVGTSNFFSFSMFQFTGSSTEVYLHCQVSLCSTKNSCAPVCRGSRRRRSVYEDPNPGLVSLSWAN